MTEPTQKTTSPMHGAPPGDLLGRTLRTMGLLVGACVLFVGSLSTVAVVVASKATAAPAGEVDSAVRPTETSAPPPRGQAPAVTPRAAAKTQSI